MTDESKAIIIDTLFTNLSSIQPEPKRYLFKPHIPLQKLSLISGDPGCGKSKLTYYIAARVTVGGDCFGSPCGKPGTVLFFSREDGIDDIKESVTACGGNADNVVGFSEKDEALSYLAKNTVTFSSWIVDEAIKKYRPALVFFDPFQKYVGRTVDTNASNQLSASLSPLITYAKRYDCAIVLITHNTKGNSSLMSKIPGSVDLVGETRSAMSLVRDPKDPNDCILIHVKSNNKIGRSMRYRIVSVPCDEDFAKVEVVGMEDYTERDFWDGERSRMQKKIDEMVSDNSPVVSAIVGLARENASGLKICRDDINKVIRECGGQGSNYTLAQIEKSYGHYLLSNHQIELTLKEKQQLRAFQWNGEIVTPQKLYDRSLHIIKK